MVSDRVVARLFDANGILQGDYRRQFRRRLSCAHGDHQRDQAARTQGRRFAVADSARTDQRDPGATDEPRRCSATSTTRRYAIQSLWPEMYKAGWTGDAKDRWKGIENWQIEFMDERPDYEGIVGRTGEQTLKIATIRAISRNPTRPRLELKISNGRMRSFRSRLTCLMKACAST
jgi:hypothetical protein